MNSYATDGKCHAAPPGTWGDECGKPAAWIATRPSGFRTGYCDACKRAGIESGPRDTWARLDTGYPTRESERAECHRQSMAEAVGIARCTGSP